MVKFLCFSGQSSLDTSLNACMALLIMIGSCNLLKMFANKVDTINDLLEDLGKNKFAIETNVYKTVKVRFLWFLSLIGLACVFNFLFWYCYIEVFNLGKFNDIKHILCN